MASFAELTVNEVVAFSGLEEDEVREDYPYLSDEDALFAKLYRLAYDFASP